MTPLTPGRIQELARAGRIARHPRYHAGRHGIGWPSILHALTTCYHVHADRRTRTGGQAAHPRGWAAYAALPGRRILRIDLDHDDDWEPPILVVTAYTLSRR